MFARIVLACVVLALPGDAVAQELLAPKTPGSNRDDPLFATPAAGPLPAAPQAMLPALDESKWSADIVLGLPIALRLQRQLGDSRVWFETGASLYVFVPSVFVGLRFDGVLHRSERDGLHIRPGVDVYYSPIRGDGFLFGRVRGVSVVAIDFDMSWRHQWSNGLAGHVGMKLGAGAGFYDNHVFPVPVIGFTCGLQF